MPEIIEGVHPTRMELLEIKERIELAEKGHKLLKEKRDSLLTEFFEVVEEAKGIREELGELMKKGRKSEVEAEALMDSSQVGINASSTPETAFINVEMKNIMGVSIPEIDLEERDEEEREKNYSLISASSRLDDSKENFEKILEKLVQLIEVEETVRRLGEEIRKTKRRVNALEYNMIPLLKNTQKYIETRLEEMEREDFVRLKMVKKKKE